jgi:hypothetical protein
VIEKESLKFKELEHVLIEKVEQLFRDMLEISHTLAGELLKGLGFSLQANRKTREGDSHPGRDAQFCHINAQVAAALAENEPVIPAGTKKQKEGTRRRLQPRRPGMAS